MVVENMAVDMLWGTEIINGNIKSMFLRRLVVVSIGLSSVALKTQMDATLPVNIGEGYCDYVYQK